MKQNLGYFILCALPSQTHVSRNMVRQNTGVHDDLWVDHLLRRRQHLAKQRRYLTLIAGRMFATNFMMVSDGAAMGDDGSIGCAFDVAPDGKGAGYAAIRNAACRLASDFA
jgi:hypothetical protein